LRSRARNGAIKTRASFSSSTSSPSWPAGSVIVYQHLGQRHMPREEFVKSQLERLAEVRPSYEVFALVGPLAAALCAELPERGELADAAGDLATSWPGGKAQVITRS
jgi:hypothetical protein